MKNIHRFVLCALIVLSPALLSAYTEKKKEPLKRQETNYGKISFSAQLSHGKVMKNDPFNVVFYFESPKETVTKKMPLNLSIVIDRSGSMAEKGKMEYAKAAAKEFIKRLDHEDRIAIVAYDDKVEVLAPASLVGPNRDSLIRKIDLLEPRGSTNLSGGMMEGAKQIEKFLEGGSRINRVLVLSDGLANEGVVDLPSLSKMAESLSLKGIQVSTFGMGADFDEDVMTRIADASGGNYYFIQNAQQSAAVFEKERSALSSVMGRNVSLSLTLPKGVTLMDAYGYSYRKIGNLTKVNLSDFFSGQKRKIVMSFKTDKAEGFQVELIKAVLNYKEIKSEIDLAHTAILKADITKSDAEHEASSNKEVIAEVNRTLANYRIGEAMQNFKIGDKSKAGSLLGEAKMLLQQSNQLSPSPSGQGDINDLEEMTRAMQDNDADSEEGKIMIKSNKESSRSKQINF